MTGKLKYEQDLFGRVVRNFGVESVTVGGHCRDALNSPGPDDV
jgi:hypothetical protein